MGRKRPGLKRAAPARLRDCIDSERGADFQAMSQVLNAEFGGGGGSRTIQGVDST